MADILSKGSLFPEELIPDFIKKTTGASALAKLCSATPIPFNGVKEFTFSLDKEVDIVAENGAKTKGGLTVDPITIVPIKIEYGARISDEFLYASEDAQLDYMSAFADGFAKKVAKGLDLMAFHGVNPRTGTASSVIGTNHFDSKVTQAVTIASGDKPDENIEAAIALVQGADRDVTGMVLAPAFKSTLAKQTTADGAKLYPPAGMGRKSRRGERSAGGVHLQPVLRLQPRPRPCRRFRQLLQVGLCQGDPHRGHPLRQPRQ